MARKMLLNFSFSDGSGCKGITKPLDQLEIHELDKKAKELACKGTVVNVLDYIKEEN